MYQIPNILGQTDTSHAFQFASTSFECVLVHDYVYPKCLRVQYKGEEYKGA
jgi:hypothetical protein